MGSPVAVVNCVEESGRDEFVVGNVTEFVAGNFEGRVYEGEGGSGAELLELGRTREGSGDVESSEEVIVLGLSVADCAGLDAYAVREENDTFYAGQLLGVWESEVV